MDSPDKIFRNMAERIVHNADQKFGGAVVIVPPQDDLSLEAKTIEFLLLGERSDVAQFFSTITTRIQIAMQDIDMERRRRQGFGG